MRVRAEGFGGAGRSIVEIRGEDERSGGKRFSPLGCSVVEFPGGLSLVHVCARWCPTLPHPGGCSTIGAVRLSFRVRDGSGRFPVAVTTETTTWAVRGRRLWYESIRLSVMAAPTRARACAWCVCGWSGWVGCGPYSGRSRSCCFTHPSPHVVCGVCWGVVVCVGLLVPVSSQTVAGLPLLAYQPSSLLGAYQKGQVLLVETLS